MDNTKGLANTTNTKYICVIIKPPTQYGTYEAMLKTLCA
ncbi:predicted protein [Sclerotinia sclerotiorum 1980 UF-70]|uniref:Uncharacterized protein n=1 Tax=Sclerotinia sclerotiorum (strain ATCC 18683 / 1980 / Ss-1) TaxID=665079 RepID=A7EVF8_SCLS1|nr:predicted protein [Sclerotinia sclerotiorum 1980 UF-70]EDN93450.1 predicted protein [Sclerotinia sclerotiorum 1980 UF-70]